MDANQGGYASVPRYATLIPASASCFTLRSAGTLNVAFRSSDAVSSSMIALTTPSALPHLRRRDWSAFGRIDAQARRSRQPVSSALLSARCATPRGGGCFSVTGTAIDAPGASGNADR